MESRQIKCALHGISGLNVAKYFAAFDFQRGHGVLIFNQSVHEMLWTNKMIGRFRRWTCNPLVARFDPCTTHQSLAVSSDSDR